MNLPINIIFHFISGILGLILESLWLLQKNLVFTDKNTAGVYTVGQKERRGGMPDSFQYIGKFLIIFGIVITLVGALLLLFQHTGIPPLGKLPGDIAIHRKNFTFYFPFTTSIILSIILSLILYFIVGRK